MKKLSILAAASMMAACAFAALPSYVMFSSEGPDTYADGTPVMDGEVYALVWAKTGSAFAGFNADGTLVDATNNKLVSAAPIATAQHCPPVMYMLTGANSDLDATGSFSVYLMDTRVKTATETKVGGLNADGTFAAVNTTTEVAEAVKGGSSAKAEAAPASAAVATAVPADAPTPKITAVQVVGGKVIVKVSDTVPYLQYGISAGKTPSNLNQKDLVDGVNGTAEGLTLVVDDPADNRFFKVIRK